MKKIEGAVLLFAGILGALFVGTYDILAGKPINDISGPKSLIGFTICAFLIVLGTGLILKRWKK